MDARSASHALGGEASGNTVLCPGPGHSKADRSLSVTFDATAPDGFLTYSFTNDDFAACRDHVRSLLGIGVFEPRSRGERPARTFAVPIAHDPTAARKRDYAASLWNEARPIAGTIVQTYLENRGIIVPCETLVGRAIRFHQACPFKLDSGETVRLPSMVAAVVDIRSNEFLALHRTALAADGSGKAKVRGMPEDGRKMLAGNKGGVVKLSADEDVTHGLGLGEGLETCLSVMGNYGFRPMWATLSTSILAKFPVLPGVDFLTIWADNDPLNVRTGRYPGADAARECGERWAGEGKEGEILAPPMLSPDGADFNDLVQGRAA